VWNKSKALHRLVIVLNGIILFKKCTTTIRSIDDFYGLHTGLLFNTHMILPYQNQGLVYDEGDSLKPKELYAAL